MVSGGGFTTVTAALNSITDASTSNHYIIYFAPGVYNEQVTMKPFVDIEGAGELTTRITFTSSASNTTGTLLGGNIAELRFLTVENTGGNMIAIAIYNKSVAPRLSHVIASPWGGTNNSGALGVRMHSLSWKWIVHGTLNPFGNLLSWIKTSEINAKMGSCICARHICIL